MDEGFSLKVKLPVQTKSWGSEAVMKKLVAGLWSTIP